MPGSSPFAVSGEADWELHEAGSVDTWSEVGSPVGWHAWNIWLRAYKTIYGFTSPSGAKLFPADVASWT